MKKIAFFLAMAGLTASPVLAKPSRVCEAEWHDAARQRTVPVRVRMPAEGKSMPIVLFSHGLGGKLDAGTDWAEAWAAGGIATVHIQHPGSDENLWKGAQDRAGIVAALRSGATPEQALARILDVGFVLDELARRKGEALAGGCALAGLDQTRIGMAGHSFGAVTTQAIAGQKGPGGRMVREPRVRAALAFSPSPAANVPDTEAFGSISMPFLSITGTNDMTPALSRTSAEDRLRPFRAMPPGNKYLLVFAEADHAIFNGHELRRAAAPVDAHVRKTVATVTTRFWHAFLSDDPSAKSWLMEKGDARSLLTEMDQFSAK